MITPVIDEAANLPARARELATQKGPWDWIVVDGGSGDDSLAVAAAAGATVLCAPRGRGTQLNAGAARAQGDVLLFLHADTALPPDAFAQIRAALRDAAVVGGHFTFAFDDRSVAGRLLAFVYAAKRMLFRVWYGDSALFVRTATFRALGGFAPFPIMEDADFVERLRRAGPTRRLRAVVTASSRRYRGRVWQTIVRWTVVFVLYKVGVAPRRLAGLYPPHRATEATGRAAARSPADDAGCAEPPAPDRSARG